LGKNLSSFQGSNEPKKVPSLDPPRGVTLIDQSEAVVDADLEPIQLLVFVPRPSPRLEDSTSLKVNRVVVTRQ